MGENESTRASVSFINLETGEEICSFDTTPLSLSPNVSADTETTYSVPSSLSFTLDDYENNWEMWNNLVVENSRNITTEFDGYIPTLVQARVNKKKRINKKWLKRYGMKIGYKKIHGKMLECRADTYPDHIEISSDRCILK